jgi:hypothetical protein
MVRARRWRLGQSVGLAALTLACVNAAALARPAAQVHVLAGSTSLSAGERGFLNANVRGRWCVLGLRRLGGHSGGRAQRSPGRTVRVAWTVPTDARSGHYALAIRCARHRSGLRQARAATLAFDVHGGSGTHLPLSVRHLKLRRRGHFERLRASDKLLPGFGDPAGVALQLAPNTGGGGFATYLPFAQGTRVQISQPPHGTTSHNDVYNFDAVDLVTAVGTPVHAGFTGVVARINTGCGPYSPECGDGYGNYVYLKAIDGTCAQMGHLSRVDVAYGQTVQQYDVVGLSGVSGHTGGPHVHYNRVDCVTNRSLPWAPVEGGALVQWGYLTSQNHPPAQPCLVLQGGCGPPVQGSSPPIQGSSPPIQGGGGGSGGGGTSPPPISTPQPPPKSVQIGWSGAHPGWIWMTLNGFPTGSHQYTCSFGSGGNQTFTLTETASPQSWDNGHTCYDLIHGDTVWVVIEGVSSNTIVVP